MPIKFQVMNESGEPIGQACDSLREAVLDAAAHDGWGACMQRDDEGDMRLYSSRYHIGNNPYLPRPRDAFSAWSSLPDDDAAEAQLAEEVRKNGVLHSRYRLKIIELTYDGQLLTHIDGRSLKTIIREDYGDADGITADSIRNWYESK